MVSAKYYEIHGSHSMSIRRKASQRSTILPDTSDADASYWMAQVSDVYPADYRPQKTADSDWRLILNRWDSAQVENRWTIAARLRNSETQPPVIAEDLNGWNSSYRHHPLHWPLDNNPYLLIDNPHFAYHHHRRHRHPKWDHSRNRHLLIEYFQREHSSY